MAPPDDPLTAASALPDAPSHELDAWWRITRALATAVTPEAVTRVVLSEGIEAFGANGGIIALRSPTQDALDVIAHQGYDPDRMQQWRVVPLTLSSPTAQAYMRREALFLETRAQAIAEYPGIERALGQFTGSLVALPLLVGSAALGALLLTFDRPRAFADPERLFLNTLVAQCAQALQRSAALHDAEALNDRLTFLAGAGELLASSLALNDTLDSIARLAVPRLADWCAVYLPADDGTLAPVAVVHQAPEMVVHLKRFISRYPIRADASNGTGRVFTTGEPDLVAAITDEMIDALPFADEWKADVRHLGLRSTLSVPLRAAGRSVGVLGLGRSTFGLPFVNDDVRFAMDVARRAGLAVENARLYADVRSELRERERAQRELARLNETLEVRVQERTRELEAANRELEAFTYSASHDLKAPTRHILSFTQLLSKQLDPHDARAWPLLQQITKAAERMDQLTDGLLTLSRSGRTPLDLHAVRLDALVRDTIRDLEPEWRERRVEWRVSPLPAVAADAMLLRGALWNLLGNAVKYSRGREVAVIEIWAEPADDAVAVHVRDNGAGFDPKFAHKLFGVFSRLHRHDQFEGIGVGLANVKRVVERHGGRVWAQGRPDAGATFSFSLPRATRPPEE